MICDARRWKKAEGRWRKLGAASKGISFCQYLCTDPACLVSAHASHFHYALIWQAIEAHPKLHVV